MDEKQRQAQVFTRQICQKQNYYDTRNMREELQKRSGQQVELQQQEIQFDATIQLEQETGIFSKDYNMEELGNFEQRFNDHDKKFNEQQQSDSD
ncbi:hypothetical protein SS50377_20190 [Spironucleus salmonicida]|uniref:Uncharacterized protein n=1 Tax=Spironucleus salmonicida TaxID=348837 RepID=V6LKT8_9EUKA|nr:hypothetical protein SS50377_20190 [Spironucleus salmonicida]|eukprot:EST45245.1 Hypothetical protein SS50377_14821 [Spironucleus salmonicida]